MPIDPEQKILEQYDEGVELYERFTQKVKGLVEEVLADTDLQLQTITSRVKDRDRLRDKIRRRKLKQPDNPYEDIAEITDVSGVRIITYFADEVDEVAEYLKQEFEVDEENSVDKRKELGVEEFGYRALHLVVGIHQDRKQLTEYRRFLNMRSEIQMLSVVQHGWAEIEHDLKYKARADVPDEFVRRFARLASKLEEADEEFQNIRDELTEFWRNLQEQIDTTPQDVEVDAPSLTEFVKGNPMVMMLDDAIAGLANGAVYRAHEYVDTTHISKTVLRLRLIGVSTIESLETQLVQYKPRVLAFASRWFRERRRTLETQERPYFAVGVSALYLVYVLAAQEMSSEELQEFVVRAQLTSYPDRSDLARRIRDAYESSAVDALVIEALASRWRLGEEPVESAEIYAQLVEEGNEVPEGVMNELLDDLDDAGLIRGPGVHDKEGIRRHGARTVTWLSPWLL